MASENLHTQQATASPSVLDTKPDRSVKKRPLFWLVIVAVLFAFFGGIFGFFLEKSKKTEPTNPDRLSSFYTNKIEYDQAFTDAATTSASPAYAAITSHHFLAKNLIAGTMTHIDPASIEQVILISPDHFSALTDMSAIGVFTQQEWDTPYGIFQIAHPTAEMVDTLPGISEDRTPFLKEHGVYTIVPFLKKQFPAAKLLPIIVRQSDDYQRYANFGRQLAQNIHAEKTLVVVSSDFSHLKTPADAKLDDQKSIAALKDARVESAANIQSDCKVCMAILFGYLEGKKTNFQLIENTNSFDISTQSPESVTSYVSGFFGKNNTTTIQSVSSIAPITGAVAATPQPSPAADKLTLLFGGDLMFDRNIRLKLQQFGMRHSLQELESLFAGYDYVIANLEGPITTSTSKSVGSAPGSTNNFLFTFDPKIAQTLFDQHLRIVNLGNNHILNFGTAGAASTKEYLKASNVQFFGDTTIEKDSAERTLIIEAKGLKIGFVSYNQFVTNGEKNAKADLAWIRPQVDLVVVYTHWGNEYVPTANNPIVTLAHQFVDAGADLVIGSHPHVIQNKEDYKGKRIYYSLGNMVFDQYFQPEVQKGLLVGVTIDVPTKAFAFTELEIQLKTNGQTVLKPVP
jgi:AmmeMemoRadiSam system protein B